MPPRKTASAAESTELNVTVRQLTEEVRVLRQAVDELRDDVVWAARQVLGAGYEAAGKAPPQPRDPLAPDAGGATTSADSTAEAADEDLYCCDSPRLAWHGSPDVPGIACENCGFVIAEEGNILIWNEEPDDAGEHEARPTEQQGTLFE